jgi:hypothetical protein
MSSAWLLGYSGFGSRQSEPAELGMDGWNEIAEEAGLQVEMGVS